MKGRQVGLVGCCYIAELLIVDNVFAFVREIDEQLENARNISMQRKT